MSRRKKTASFSIPKSKLKIRDEASFLEKHIIPHLERLLEEARYRLRQLREK